MKCPHCGKSIKVHLISQKDKSTRKRRNPRKNTIASHIVDYLNEYNRPAKVSNIADALLEKNINTKAKNFRAVVNRTLVVDKRFKSVRRGYYSLTRGRRQKISGNNTIN